MKNSKSFIILISSFAVSFATTVNAGDMNKEFEKEPAQVIDRYGSVSTEKLLESSELLLNKSTIARRLKVSEDPVFRSIYFRALDIYQSATDAYLTGNYPKAKELALESIQIIARSVPRLYDRANKKEKLVAAKKP